MFINSKCQSNLFKYNSKQQQKKQQPKYISTLSIIPIPSASDHSISDAKTMNLSTLRGAVRVRGAWGEMAQGLTKSQAWQWLHNNRNVHISHLLVQSGLRSKDPQYTEGFPPSAGSCHSAYDTEESKEGCHCRWQRRWHACSICVTPTEGS